MNAHIDSEGPEKATRGGGGEWEPIKIPCRNLAYILKLTLSPSLLTQSRPPTIGKLSALRTGLGTTAETRNGARKTSCEIDDRNQLEKQFISSQVFHRTPGGRDQKTTAEERFEL
jgi:hypothetical protein